MILDALLVTRLLTIAPSLYPMKAPKNYATPCVVYNMLNVDPIRALDEGGAEVASYIYQIDVYDPSHLQAQTTAESIRNNLVEWIEPGVQAVEWTGQTQMIDDTTDVELFRQRMTFIIFAGV